MQYFNDHMKYFLHGQRENKAQNISLDLNVKGDKFLYYKRRFQKLENRVKVFPFWNSLYVWGAGAFSIFTLYFILFLIDHTLQDFPLTITLIHLDTVGIPLPKNNLYALLFIPLVIFIINFFFAYKIYNRRKYIAVLLITCSCLFTLLFLISIIKVIQMHVI